MTFKNARSLGPCFHQELGLGREKPMQSEVLQIKLIKHKATKAKYMYGKIHSNLATGRNFAVKHQILQGCLKSFKTVNKPKLACDLCDTSQSHENFKFHSAFVCFNKPLTLDRSRVSRILQVQKADVCMLLPTCQIYFQFARLNHKYRCPHICTYIMCMLTAWSTNKSPPCLVNPPASIQEFEIKIFNNLVTTSEAAGQSQVHDPSQV